MGDGKAIASYVGSVILYALAALWFGGAQQKVDSIYYERDGNERKAIIEAIDNQSGGACFVALMGLVLWGVASDSQDWDVWYTISWFILVGLIMQIIVMISEQGELVTHAKDVASEAALSQAPERAARGVWSTMQGIGRVLGRAKRRFDPRRPTPAPAL